MSSYPDTFLSPFCFEVLKRNLLEEIYIFILEYFYLESPDKIKFHLTSLKPTGAMPKYNNRVNIDCLMCH